MSEEYNNYQESNQQPKKRPVFLTVLCVLSFIAIGFSFLGLVLALTSGKPTAEEIENTYNLTMQTARDLRVKNMVAFADFFEQAAELASFQQQNYWKVMGMNLLTTGCGFFGVLMMFKGKRIGFHSYIIYNLLSVGGSFLIIPSHMVQFATVLTGFVFSGLFVYLYSRHLKWMNQ